MKFMIKKTAAAKREDVIVERIRCGALKAQVFGPMEFAILAVAMRRCCLTDQLNRIIAILRPSFIFINDTAFHRHQ